MRIGGRRSGAGDGEDGREDSDSLALIVSKGRLVEALRGLACPWPLPMATCFSDFACTALDDENMADAASVLVEVGGEAFTCKSI